MIPTSRQGLRGFLFQLGTIEVLGFDDDLNVVTNFFAATHSEVVIDQRIGDHAFMYALRSRLASIHAESQSAIGDILARRTTHGVVQPVSGPGETQLGVRG